MKKSLREGFARFFEAPSRETLRVLLKEHFGEMNQLDFKMQLPDRQELARHMLAMANSGGGCIIIGISQQPDNTFDLTGAPTITDKGEIQKSVQKYISNRLRYEILDFAYNDSEYKALIGKKFQIITIEDTPQYIPFLVESEGDRISKGAIYIRRNTNSEKASYEELQSILNRRVGTNYSSQSELSLEVHLKELKALYREASGNPYEYDQLAQIGGLPEEYMSWDDEYDMFIHQMIRKKRRIIEALITKDMQIKGQESDIEFDFKD